MIIFDGREYVTTLEAMNILGVKTRQTLYDFIRAKKLTPYVITGNKNYFLKSEVDKLHIERSTPKPKNSLAA